MLPGKARRQRSAVAAFAIVMGVLSFRLPLDVGARCVRPAVAIGRDGECFRLPLGGHASGDARAFTVCMRV